MQYQTLTAILSTLLVVPALTQANFCDTYIDSNSVPAYCTCSGDPHSYSLVSYSLCPWTTTPPKSEIIPATATPAVNAATLTEITDGPGSTGLFPTLNVTSVFGSGGPTGTGSTGTGRRHHGHGPRPTGATGGFFSSTPVPTTLSKILPRGN